MVELELDPQEALFCFVFCLGGKRRTWERRGLHQGESRWHGK